MPSLTQIIDICKSKQKKIEYFQNWNNVPKEKLRPKGHVYIYVNEEDNKHNRRRCKIRGCRPNRYRHTERQLVGRIQNSINQNFDSYLIMG